MSTGGNEKISKKYLQLMSISGFFLCFDQLTKLYIHLEYKLGESLPLIQNYFNLTYVRNYGAAFGFLSQTHPIFRDAFFLMVPPVVLAVIFWMLRNTPESEKKQIVSLSLVFGGALGNYVDRLKYRYVIDFLDFHFHNKYSWPAFNVADMCIVFGLGSLLFVLFKEKKSKSSPPTTQTTSTDSADQS